MRVDAFAHSLIMCSGSTPASPKATSRVISTSPRKTKEKDDGIEYEEVDLYRFEFDVDEYRRIFHNDSYLF